MQVKKQQSELDMEQWTGSKLGKEYIKSLYCHPACLTYMQAKEKSEKAGLKTGKKTQMCITDFWTQRERERERVG